MRKSVFAVRFEEGFAHSDFFLEQDALVRDLTSAEEVIWAPEKLVKDDALAVVGGGFEAYVYIRDMIDVDAALKRLEKNIGKESKVLEQTERKLSSEGFLQKADAAIVDKERQKREEMSRKIEKMRGYIEDLKR
jgi:valyl-tRNA synthetase